MLERVKKFLPLNTELMGNPVNWVIVVLMILIAGVALSLITQSAAPIKESN